VGVALQDDGKIIVGGDAGYKPTTVRLHTNGLLDTTWNGTGYSQAPMVGIAKALAVQPDGKPVIVALSGSEPSQDWLFVRWQGGGDGTPDPFAFANQTGVATGSAVSSAPVTITGFEGTLMVQSDIGYVSVGCQPYYVLAPQPITAGQTLCVQHEAASTPATTVTQTIMIGSVSATFSSTTIAVPDTSITSAPAAQTSSTDPSFSFASDTPGATFECKLDGATFAACTSPTTYASIAEGAHTFQVRAVTGAGQDPTPASHTWTIDTTAPDTTITGGPSGLVNYNYVTFDLSSNEAGSTFECRFDGAAFAPCTSPVNTGGLAEGSHTFEARAKDAVGNVDATPATRTWAIDFTSPNTTITGGPLGAVSSTSATFTFTSNESPVTFQCSLDGAAFAACTSPVLYSGLAQGSHTFQVRATDGVGNQDATPASSTWTVDTTAPDTTITSTPANNSLPPATFTFTSSEPAATFECRLDGAAFAPCTSPLTYSTLAKGQHTFDVRARDAAGNTDATPASYSWRSR
jgi:hypothetical protein